MRFDDHFLDDIRARLPVSQVVGRTVALKRSGRELAGLSPFKSEKTPSFFVNDQKGFYHCFASGAHGDIFKFVMSTQGLTFPEAVEMLAAQAGVPMPARSQSTARDVQVRDERQRLYDLLDASAQFFRRQLGAGSGASARRYIETRGLTSDTIAQFGLGFAPNSKTALKEHLAERGFTVGEMVISGMLIGGDDIPVPYDRFRNRVMFPITDLKGRSIAFGGRALDVSQPAKYLNSPETPLFHKGSILFNAATARPIAHTSRRLIVVEGYMDVVALSQAGFGDAVAPLGTALTADQVKLLWRYVPEPVLCFDGDSAGRKAAFRAIDTVLPHLTPGHSVAFAFLPDGLDPDDLVRQRGPEALAAILKAARPLIDVLFERETAVHDMSTPERRAALEVSLRNLTRTIADASVRSHYERDIKNRMFEITRRTSAGFRGQSASSTSFRPVAKGQRSAKPGWPRAPAPPAASQSLRDSSLANAGVASLPHRECLLLRAAINHPWLIDRHSEALCDLHLTAPSLIALRAALLAAHAAEKTLDSEELRSHLIQRGFSSTLVAIEPLATHRQDRFAETSSTRDIVEEGWLHCCALHAKLCGVRQSLETAEHAWYDDPSAEIYGSIVELQQQLIIEPQFDASEPTSHDP